MKKKIDDAPTDGALPEKSPTNVDHDQIPYSGFEKTAFEQLRRSSTLEPLGPLAGPTPRKPKKRI